MFFKGISGLNFKLYDVGDNLMFIPFDISYNIKSPRYLNAGFETQSFIINSSDITLFYLITIASYCVYYLIAVPFRLLGKPKVDKFFKGQLNNFKYTAFL